MARPTVFKHRKFRRLVLILGEPVPHVLGYLECMWHVGYESGDPLLGDEVDVELACQWPGERGALCARLLEVGFIDRDAEGRFTIHDLPDHAPEYVAARARKEAERKKDRVCHCGVTFHSTEVHALHCSDACRQTAYRQRRVTEGDGPLRNNVTDGRNNVTDVTGALRAVTGSYAPPAPAPAPAPNNNTPLTPLGGQSVPPDPQVVSRRKPRPKPSEWDGTLPEGLDVPEFRAAWGNWEEDRKRRRKGLTPEARRLQLRDCLSWGAARAALAVEASIKNGWSGLFEPKPEAARAAGANGPAHVIDYAAARRAAREADIKARYADLDADAQGVGF